MLSHDAQRLIKISEYCEDIKNTISRCGDSFARFEDDVDMQRSIAFSILQVAELSAKLTTELRDASSNEIDWRGIRSFRNIVVHDYGKIKLEVVWSIACNDIPILKEFCDKHIPAEDEFV